MYLRVNKHHGHRTDKQLVELMAVQVIYNECSGSASHSVYKHKQSVWIELVSRNFVVVLETSKMQSNIDSDNKCLPIVYSLIAFLTGLGLKCIEPPSICYEYDENKHIDLFPLCPQPKPYHPHYQFKPIMPFTKPNCGVTSLEPPKPSNIKNWLQYIYDSEEKSDST